MTGPLMTAGASKQAKTCPTRGAHEHVYKGGEWSRQCSLHYSQHTKTFKRHAIVDLAVLNFTLSLNVPKNNLTSKSALQ